MRRPGIVGVRRHAQPPQRAAERPPQRAAESPLAAPTASTCAARKRPPTRRHAQWASGGVCSISVGDQAAASACPKDSFRVRHTLLCPEPRRPGRQASRTQRSKPPPPHLSAIPCIFLHLQNRLRFTPLTTPGRAGRGLAPPAAVAGTSFRLLPCRRQQQVWAHEASAVDDQRQLLHARPRGWGRGAPRCMQPAAVPTPPPAAGHAPSAAFCAGDRCWEARWMAAGA